MRPNKDRRTEIILYGLLLIPLLFAAAALAQATEQAQGLAEITVVLSSILNNPMALKWCASTPKFLLAVLVLYPLAVYCYMLDQADRHPGQVGQRPHTYDKRPSVRMKIDHYRAVAKAISETQKALQKGIKEAVTKEAR